MGCGGTGINFIDNFQSVVIEPVGRSFSTLDDRVKIDVPANAFARTVTMTIAKAAGLPALPFLLLATGFDVRISGGTPQKPIGLTVRFDPKDITPGILPESITLFRVVEGAATALDGAKVDIAAGTVSIDLEQLDGTFVVGSRL
jgi:hypothetical protein